MRQYQLLQLCIVDYKKQNSRLQEATGETLNRMQNTQIQKQIYLSRHTRGIRRRDYRLRRKQYCEIRIGHWHNPHTEKEEEKLLEKEGVWHCISCKILNDTNNVLSYPQ